MINREIIYERNLTGSYMKIPVSYEGEFDEKMMLKRKLPGLLPVEKCFVNGNGQYWYQISGKQSLDTYCRMKPVGIHFVKQMVVSICSEIEILEWNLLKPNILLLDPELIFVTNSNQEIIFTIYPGAKTEVALEFQQLMEYLLTKIDHKDAAAVHMAYEIYEKTLDEGYSLMDIRDSLIESREAAQEEAAADNRFEKRIENRTEKRSEKRLENRTEKRSEKQTGKRLEIKKMGKQPEKQGENQTEKSSIREYVKTSGIGALKERREEIEGMMRDHWREISEKWKAALKFMGKKTKEPKELPLPAVTYPGEAEPEEPAAQEPVYPTVCLSSYREHPEGILLYEGKEHFSNIRIEGEECRIGKGDGVDAAIEKDTISRFHARIHCENQEYYIEDLNSTNGTFINDETLSYKERRQLKPNDRIRFADVRYRFL